VYLMGSVTDLLLERSHTAYNDDTGGIGVGGSSSLCLSPTNMVVSVEYSSIKRSSRNFGFEGLDGSLVAAVTLSSRSPDLQARDPLGSGSPRRRQVSSSSSTMAYSSTPPCHMPPCRTWCIGHRSSVASRRRCRHLGTGH
jgi:hypothetical protein